MSIYKTHKGRYKPVNPDKYRGDLKEIIYRSSWELTCMIYLDRSEGVIWWNSEGLIIPYTSPIDGRAHRYFPDFVFKTTNGETFIWEVKPDSQTRPPEKKSRITKRYLREVKTWAVNQAKWEAAKRYCEKKKAKFALITEKQLFKKR